MKPKPKILIYSLVFSPDGVSTAYLYNDLALGLKKKGFEVVVLTTTPHFNPVEEQLKKQPLSKKAFGLFFKSNFNGISVYHVPLKKYKNTSIRILSFLYWHLISFILGLSLGKFKVILSPSPPLTNGVIITLLGKLKRAKTIYNVQELYPDLLINTGRLNNSFLIKLLKQIEKWVYHRASSITVIDKTFYNIISKRVNLPKKVKIIPNFVDTDLYTPNVNWIDKLPGDIFKKDNNKINILYAGNIGIAQDWDIIINTALKSTNEAFHFWIIGEGVKKKYLEKMIAKYQLNNITLLPYQDRNLMPAINSFADIHIIAMDPLMDKEGFPSKVYTIMSSAKPLLVVSSKNTPIYEFLKDKNCAILTSEREPDTIIKILNENSNQNTLIELGKKGTEIIKRGYSKEAIINKYYSLIVDLIEHES